MANKVSWTNININNSINRRKRDTLIVIHILIDWGTDMIHLSITLVAWDSSIFLLIQWNQQFLVHIRSDCELWSMDTGHAPNMSTSIMIWENNIIQRCIYYFGKCLTCARQTSLEHRACLVLEVWGYRDCETWRVGCRSRIDVIMCWENSTVIWCFSFYIVDGGLFVTEFYAYRKSMFEVPGLYSMAYFHAQTACLVVTIVILVNTLSLSWPCPCWNIPLFLPWKYLTWHFRKYDYI